MHNVCTTLTLTGPSHCQPAPSVGIELLIFYFTAFDLVLNLDRHLPPRPALPTWSSCLFPSPPILFTLLSEVFTGHKVKADWIFSLSKANSVCLNEALLHLRCSVYKMPRFIQAPCGRCCVHYYCNCKRLGIYEEWEEKLYQPGQILSELVLDPWIKNAEIRQRYNEWWKEAAWCFRLDLWSFAPCYPLAGIFLKRRCICTCFPLGSHVLTSGFLAWSHPATSGNIWNIKGQCCFLDNTRLSRIKRNPIGYLWHFQHWVVAKPDISVIVFEWVGIIIVQYQGMSLMYRNTISASMLRHSLAFSLSDSCIKWLSHWWRSEEVKGS